jgi:ribosomal-protein-alanine N-acetyltransferase
MAESSIIKTTRLRIVPFSEEHLTCYVGWLNDPEVVRYSEQRHRKHTLESCREYWQSFSGSPNYFWAITTLSNEIGHIGNINAYVDRNNSVADVGVLIGERSVWGKGYGLETWKAVCDYLLIEAGIRKVTAGTLAVNKGMLSIMERSGMIPDGLRIRQALIEEIEVDIVYAAFFK